jgi:tRNA A-37 threonylcarbamoyl transferase component Bud32
MQDVKDTRRAHVRIAFDGRVFKSFRGHQARERFENEVRVLRYLEKRGCPFVPVVLETNDADLLLVTSNCGKIVENIGAEKMEALHKELHKYGVRHGDWDMRNITYSQQLGRFCIIDFEFASILDDPTHVSPVPMPAAVNADEK